MELRYRFQKNKDNGQKIKYLKSTNTKLCPVRAGLRIRRRGQRLRLVAIEVYNLTLPDDIKSSGKDSEFIKFRLRWKSDTFRLYLRNTTLMA
eukprot:7164409-Ditylum_brightwellii.AAC.1